MGSGTEPYSPNHKYNYQLKEHELTMLRMKEKAIKSKEAAAKGVEERIERLNTDEEEGKEAEGRLKK